MDEAKWYESAKQLSEHLVVIRTKDGTGTGFFIGTRGKFAGIATAYHVIEQAQRWQSPIEIAQPEANSQVNLYPHFTRGVELKINAEMDSALIVFEYEHLVIPQSPLPIVNQDEILTQGSEIGWCGYPAAIGALAKTPCFFHGYVSAWLSEKGAYVVDGTAINGVSGCPAFVERADESGNPTIVGLVTAYIPNLAIGSPLPGVSLVYSINHYLPILAELADKMSTERVTEDAD